MISESKLKELTLSLDIGIANDLIEGLQNMKTRYTYVDEFSKAVDGLISLLLDRIARIEEEIRGLQAND